MTVVGGYLGAGKTTLINSVLADAGGRRIVVLVNDFGEINIDAELISSRDGDTISLTNGCVCCSITDGLAMVMTDLAQYPETFDHVLIEVSGVGDPWKVAQWGRAPGFELDGVVVLAAADSVMHHFTDRYIGETVSAQLARADLVVLTRSDLVPADARPAVEEVVRERTPGSVLVARSDEIGLSLLLGAGPGTGGPTPDHPSHQTWTIAPSDIAAGDLQAWLDSAPPGVWRVKGFVRCPDRATEWTTVQKVGRRAELDPAMDHTGTASLVVIGAPGTEQRDVERWLDTLPNGSRSD